MQQVQEPPSGFTSTLIPILREGVDVVKMILFKELKSLASREYEERGQVVASRLAGAILNEIFGTPNNDPEFMTFTETHRKEISHLFKMIQVELERFRIPLTDALRISALCDHQEGVDNALLLENAQQLGLLLIDREMPMPHTFIELVRRLGVSYGLLSPVVAPTVQ